MSDSVRPLRWQPTRLPRPWDSPGKNTVILEIKYMEKETVKKTTNLFFCETKQYVTKQPMDHQRNQRGNFKK